MERVLGHRLRRTLKVIREQHIVGFRVGTTAAELMAMLTLVPGTATVSDIDCVDESSDVTTEEVLFTTIVFHHETSSGT